MALVRQLFTLRCIRPRINLSSTATPSRIQLEWKCLPSLRLLATDSSGKSNNSQKSPAAESPEEVGNQTATQQPELDKLNADLAACKEQLGEMNDKYKRALADAENMRRRFMKQVDDAKVFGIQGFCKDLLEVADVLQKATESVPPEQLSGQNVHLKSLYQGLQMTQTELQKVFGRNGLVPINPMNEKFNPNYHEALFQQPADGKDSGTVIVVSKIGYKLRERVIRPALVGVAQ